MPLPACASRFLFFTGKGGVGKTSLSCAAGVAFADAGKRVLIVSTDPASNLDEVLGVALAEVPTAIDAVPGLWALNIDPEAAAAALAGDFAPIGDMRASAAYRAKVAANLVLRFWHETAGTAATRAVRYG